MKRYFLISLLCLSFLIIIFNVITPNENINNKDYIIDNNADLELDINNNITNWFQDLPKTADGIFLPDTRTRVLNTDDFPWVSIIKLISTFPDSYISVGSGAIIDERHVLTAAHTIYQPAHGGAASNIDIIPGMDNGNPLPAIGTAQATFLRYGPDWETNYGNDWGLVTLDSDIGALTGWMPLQTASSSDSIYEGALATAGYPIDLDSGDNQYKTYNNGVYATSTTHVHTLDGWNGQSGSPIWYYDGEDNYILSIFIRTGSTTNLGARLDQGKINNIINFLYDDAPIPKPSIKPDMKNRGENYAGFSGTMVGPGLTSFDVWSDVKNIGRASTGTFSVSYYASTDTTISDSDYLIGTDTVSSIGAYSFDDSSWSGTFPNGVPSGTYYIGWIIDRLDSIDELDENNNKAYESSYQLEVDATDPSSSISYTPESLPNKINKTTSFSLSANDGSGSGVDSIKYRIDSGGWTTYSGAFTLSGYSKGEYTIEYYSTDNVGNEESFNSEVVDKTDAATSVGSLVITGGGGGGGGGGGDGDDEYLNMGIVMILLIALIGAGAVATVVVVVIVKKKEKIPERSIFPSETPPIQPETLPPAFLSKIPSKSSPIVQSTVPKSPPTTPSAVQPTITPSVPRFCIKCGESLDLSQIFCIKCGTRILK